MYREKKSTSILMTSVGMYIYIFISNFLSVLWLNTLVLILTQALQLLESFLLSMCPYKTTLACVHNTQHIAVLIGEIYYWPWLLSHDKGHHLGQKIVLRQGEGVKDYGINFSSADIWMEERHLISVIFKLLQFKPLNSCFKAVRIWRSRQQ